jgi:hypothetical protein
MKKIYSFLFFIAAAQFASAQSIDKIINAAEVERIERTLSSDEMRGRKTFTPDIDRAADFIANEFKKNHLQYLAGLSSYRQEFSLLQSKLISVHGNVNGQPLDQNNVAVVTTEEKLNINSTSGYEKVSIAAGATFRSEVTKYIRANKNLLVVVDTSFSKVFSSISRFNQPSTKKNNSVVFILSPIDIVDYSLQINSGITERKLANVVGVVPGRSRKEEYVVFGGHYDHLGVGKPDAKGDSIYNGANDDAAGTTAVIMLSKYFRKLKNNARTLVFVAFTAEEVGGYGSQYFSKQLDPAKVVAMFNLEMIGTESKWGKNSAYITGYERSDFGKILQRNLTDSKFHFEPDPYPKQNLFFRSDNATLARLGVPAHTISTAKMEEAPNNEPNYHRQSDEIGTLDMNNMAEIIKAIAISSTSIISGKDTPARVKIEDR